MIFNRDQTVTVNVNLGGTARLVLDLAPGLLSGLATKDDIKRLESKMSALSDAIQAGNDAADAAISRVNTDIASLKQQITDLQNQVAQGGATQADLDNLAALTAKLAALDPSNPATLPTT